MTNPIKIAFNKLTDKFVHIENIQSNDKETRRNCYCLKCDEKLEAVLEFKDKNRIKFFRHDKNPTCEGSQETALHELGKQILVENTQIKIPKYGNVLYAEPIAEKRFENIRPDVTATFEGKNIYFEIFVSHSVDEKKDKYIKENLLRCIEIDLSPLQNATYEEIYDEVLEKLENKRVIFWDVFESIQPNNKNLGCLFQILFLLVIFLGFNRLIKD